MSSVKSFDVRKDRPVSIMNSENINITELKLDDINLINQSLTNLSKINNKGKERVFTKSSSGVSLILASYFLSFSNFLFL